MSRQPRIVILVVGVRDMTSLAKTLARIPTEVLNRIEGICLLDGRGLDHTGLAQLNERLLRQLEQFTVYRSSRPLHYGEALKIGFDYAIKHEYDIVAVLHGDGHYAPEVIETLLEPVERGEADLVIGSRMLQPNRGHQAGMQRHKLVGNRLLTAFQNRVIGTRLSDFHSGYRVYRCEPLQAIPYRQCRDDLTFNTEIILQLHAGGFRIAERPIPPCVSRDIGMVSGVSYAARVIASTLKYRLHQNGLLFAEAFEIGPMRYPLKTGRWSSHQQLLRLIPSGSRVLDVGCGEGLLARLLQERGCDVVGLDQHVGALAKAMGIRTYTHDLNHGLDLEGEPPFDAILLADVLSHLKEHDRLLEDCHRRLVPGGRLIVSVGNVAHVVIRLSLLFGRFEYTPRGILERGHVALFTLGSVKRLLTRHRFRIRRVQVAPIPFEAAWPSAAASVWVRLLTCMSYGLARLWKTLFAYQFILIAEPIPVSGTMESISLRKEVASLLSQDMVRREVME